MLKIAKEKVGSKLTVRLAGRIDTATWTELEQSLDGELDGMDEVVFDLADVTYVSSAGLRVLLGARKAVSGDASFSTINANDEVRDIFEVTHLTQLLNVV